MPSFSHVIIQNSNAASNGVITQELAEGCITSQGLPIFQPHLPRGKS
jgi:hypothetical protein